MCLMYNPAINLAKCLLGWRLREFYRVCVELNTIEDVYVERDIEHLTSMFEHLKHRQKNPAPNFLQNIFRQVQL